MELIGISENLLQISKHLTLLHKYISFKFGSDWTKDFKKYCDNDNQTYLDFEIEDDTVDEFRDPQATNYDDLSAESLVTDNINIKTSMVSFHNSSSEIEICHVQTEDLEEEEKEMFFVDFEDVEHCGGDPLANTETSVKTDKIPIPTSNKSNVISDEDGLADLTLDIVPVLVKKTAVTYPTRPMRSEHSKSTYSSARKKTKTSDYIKRGDRWVCGICRNDFTLKGTLTRHLNAHRGVTFPCLDKNCTKVFTRKYYMQDHYKSAHLVV